MKIQKHKSNKKIVIIIATIFALTGVYSVSAYYSGLFPFVKNNTVINKSKDGIDYNKPTDAQTQAGEAQKKSTAVPNQDTKANSSTSNAADSEALQVTLNANQNGDQLQVRSSISKISDNGTCTITLTNGSKTVTKTSGIQALPTESTCSGFDISTSELSVGDWQITIDVVSGTNKGSVTGTYNVQ